MLLLEYPSDAKFTPKHLIDSGMLIAEMSNISNKKGVYLVSMDVATKKIDKIKDIDNTSDVSSFIVHSSNENKILFEEFDQFNRTSTYYLYNFFDKQLIKIHYIQEVVPIHYTQVTWMSDGVIFNCYDSETKQYITYMYYFTDRRLKLLIDHNSSSLISKGKDIIYISIDNVNLETNIVRKDLETRQVKVMESIKDKNKYIESLHDNDEKILKVINDNGMKKIFEIEDMSEREVQIYELPWIESLTYKKRFVTFLGNPRTKTKVRSQYYLLDVENKIDYVYVPTSKS